MKILGSGTAFIVADEESKTYFHDASNWELVRLNQNIINGVETLWQLDEVKTFERDTWEGPYKFSLTHLKRNHMGGNYGMAPELQPIKRQIPYSQLLTGKDRGRI